MNVLLLFKSIFYGIVFCMFSVLLLSPFALKIGAFVDFAPFLILFFGFVICARVCTSQKCRNRLLCGILSSFFMFLTCNIISILIFKEKPTAIFFVKFAIMFLAGVVGACRINKSKRLVPKKTKY